MSVPETYNPNRIPKTQRGLKAERVVHRVTFNPSSANPGEVLQVTIPKLSENLLVVPNTVVLRFDMIVNQGTTTGNNRVINNIGRNLINKMKVSFGGEVLLDIERYDLFRTYQDLHLTKIERSARLSQGIQSEDMCKIRSNANDKGSDTKDVALNTVYGNKYTIPLDIELMKDHGVLYPFALNDSILFELTLAKVDKVIHGTDEANYQLKNIELEYETIRSDYLAGECASAYQNGKAFLYEHVTLQTSFTFNTKTDTIISRSVNYPRRSMTGLLLLFVEPYTAGARDTEKFANPDITSVSITIDGVPNKLYSQKIQGYDLWNEMTRRYGTEIPPEDFYGDNKFALWVDLKSVNDMDIHGAGYRIVNTRDGIQLEIKRTATTAEGTMNCYVYVISDAQVSIMNQGIKAIVY